MIAGWSPWLVEAFLRFADPLQRVTTAAVAGSYLSTWQPHDVPGMPTRWRVYLPPR